MCGPASVTQEVAVSDVEGGQPDQRDADGSQAASPEASSSPSSPPERSQLSGAGSMPAIPGGSAVSRRGYPVDVDIDAPEEVARWRPLVHWILAFPLFIVLYALGIVATVCAFIGWFAALFTGELPEGLGKFIAGYYRYAWRTYSYAMFLREPYPEFGPELGYADPGNDPARFEVRQPGELSRVAVLLRIIFVIPQLVVIFFLAIALSVALVVGFFAVLFTGRWPASLRDFVVGATRWILRVDAWFLLLADPYPPFSLA